MREISKSIRGSKTMRSTTLRSFTGGLNVLDDDMNLSYKFATALENCTITSDGKIEVRYGTKLFAKLTEYFSTAGVKLVNMEFYNNAIIAVGSNGEILKINGAGAVVRIFDSSIAAMLPDAPSAWGPTDFVSFEQFNGHLIVCNGADKPLDIDQDFFVEYLQDAATGTNINVPIARYAVAVGRYLLLAGDPLFPNRIHISARDAPGTWFGDPPPNDATFVDVGSILAGATSIRGLLAFRDRVLVLFVEGTVVGTLGTYNDDGTHEPNFDDAIQGFGSVSHRAAVASGDDGLLADLFGVPSIRRTVLSSSFKPERVSEFIDPLITDSLNALSIAALEDRVFRVHDPRIGQYMLFIPNAETVDDTTETVGYIYNYRPQLKQENWAVFRGWNWTCGCRSLQGNIFFGDADGNIWIYGSSSNPIYADFIDLLSTPNNPEGSAIEFNWELPWMDFRSRERSKTSKHLSFDTRGTGEFTVKMYVDNFTINSLEMEFSGGEQGLFGDGPQPFGGGRNTAYKKLVSWPCRFQMMRLQITGSTREALGWVSITMMYQDGSIRP